MEFNKILRLKLSANMLVSFRLFFTFCNDIDTFSAQQIPL